MLLPGLTRIDLTTAYHRFSLVLLDEVLAVGDVQFQKKCLGKMGEVAHGGRTVLFVSHNMTAIRALCEHGLLLDDGILVKSGTTEDAIRAYLQSTSRPQMQREWDRE